MADYPESIGHTLRYVAVAVLIVANLFLLAVLLSPRSSAQSSHAATSTFEASTYDSPNAVTVAMATLLDRVNYAVTSADEAATNAWQSIATTAADGSKLLTEAASQTGEVVGQAGGLAAQAAQSSGKLAIHSVVNGTAFIAYVPTTMISMVTDAPVVSSIIKPADKEQVPIIDPNAPIQFAAYSAAPALQTASVTPTPQPADQTAIWPLHGEITTYFGVPHWPYQPTHSGIDISDGTVSGITAIKPFRPGRVVEVVRSYSGLGNHVVVDHGGGITSVYGHLYSIAVTEGQAVDHSTTLGTEGSTGASTGTHLHFEVRLNGQSVNPLPYLQGRH